MALIEQNTLRRAQERCAQRTHWTIRFKRWLIALRPMRRPHIRDLSDHHLQDIGLTSADIEAHRHRNPSQHTYHPRS